MSHKDVPRILHAYWSGPDWPSWLRRQTLESWRRLLPDCEIRFHQEVGDRLEDPTEAVHRSDLHRWNALYRVGGWWTDLDVIYYRSPLELLHGDPDAEFWLTCDGQPDQPYSIGLMAAVPGSEVVLGLLESALDASPAEYQSYGVRLIPPGLRADRGVGNIPHDALYVRPAFHAKMGELWGPSGWKLPTHGLHWYGGHPTSRTMEPWVDSQWVGAAGNAIGAALGLSVCSATSDKVVVQ